MKPTSTITARRSGFGLTQGARCLSGPVSSLFPARLRAFAASCLILGLGQALAFAIAIGDRVQANGTVNVRQTPAGTVLGTQSSGSRGTVTGGPTTATLNGTSYTWFNINFDAGVDGWVADIGLTLVANQAPTQTSINQYRADSGASIPGGGIVPYGVGVYFEANVNDADGDTARLEVELRLLPATFTGSPTHTSGYVGSGSRARTVTATGLSPGNYGWRVRVVDSRGAASAWIAERNPDFIVSLPPNQPPTQTFISQYRADSGASIPSGGSVPYGVGVYFEANVNDGDGDTVRLEVELRPLPATFTGSPTHTSSYTGSGSRARTVTATGLSPGNYGWRIRVVDSRGAASAWVLELNPDFVVVNAPPSASAYNQYRADTGAALVAGGSISSGIGIYFEANVNDANGDTVQLQVELRQLPATFTGVPTHISGLVSSGTRARTITATGLSPGNYGWRVRAVDSHGAASAWVAELNPDFIVQAANLAAPTLINPPDGSTGQPSNPTFNWSSVSGADLGYRILVATSPADLPTDPTSSTGGPSVVINATPSTTSFTPPAPLEPGTTYYWEVHGRSAAQYGAWSSKNSFTTAPMPNQPPTQNAINQYRADTGAAVPSGGSVPYGVGVYFEANVSDPDGDTARLEVELRQLPATFTGVATHTSGLVASGTRARTVAATGLAAGNYGWRVRVVDNRGAASSWIAEREPDFVVETTADLPLGIDVSTFQDSVDWNRVHNSGGKVFAILRATAGKNTTDSRFLQNAPNAAAAGLIVGAYHFAYPESFTAHEEAQKFLSVAGPYIGASYLPPALDIEDSPFEDSFPYRLGAAALSQWVRDWCAEVEQVAGAKPMIYSTRYYARNYFQQDLNQYPYWVVTDSGSPDSNPGDMGIWSTWRFHQYRYGESGGTCLGVAGPVDLDSFNGDLPALQALTSRTAIPPPALGFQRNAGRIVLSWPSSTTGFVLEGATVFPAQGWTPVGPAPVVVNGNFTVTNTFTGSAQYYRLRKL